MIFIGKLGQEWCVNGVFELASGPWTLDKTKNAISLNFVWCQLSDVSFGLGQESFRKKYNVNPFGHRSCLVKFLSTSSFKLTWQTTVPTVEVCPDRAWI